MSRSHSAHRTSCHYCRTKAASFCVDCTDDLCRCMLHDVGNNWLARFFKTSSRKIMGKWPPDRLKAALRKERERNDMAARLERVLPDAMRMFEGVRSVVTDSVRKYVPTYQKPIDAFIKTEHEDFGKYEIYFDNIESGAYGSTEWDGYRLPGHGFSRESCQQFVVTGCTNNHGERHVIRRERNQCKKLSCPKCFRYSVERAAGKVTDRVIAGVDYQRLVRNRKRKVVHCVISLPKSRYEEYATIKGRSKIDAEITRQLKFVGLVGGVQIRHPFRFDKKNSMQGAYVSPHIHVLGVGWIDFEKVKLNYKRTGFVIHLISSKTGSGSKYKSESMAKHAVLGTRAEVFTCARYLLSHAGVTESLHTVRYFGDFGNNKFGT